MFHAFDVVTNTKGDSLVGYQVLVRDPTTGAVIPIFADDNGTPIGTVSNLINIALTDNAGNYSFFVPFGTYNLEFRTPDGVSVRTINSVPFNSGSQGAPGRDGLDGNTGPANSTYTSLALLKAAPVTNASYIFAPPGGTEGSTTAGTFLYQTADAPYTADGVNVIKLDGVPLTTGALVRQRAAGVTYDARRSVEQRLSLDNYVTDTRYGGGAMGDQTTDDTTALQTALAVSQDLGSLAFPKGKYSVTALDTGRCESTLYLDKAAIEARATASTDAIMRFQGLHTRVFNLKLDGRFKTNYGCALWWYNASESSQHVDFFGLDIHYAKVGLIFGAKAGETSTGYAQSENTIFGFHARGVERPLIVNHINGFLFLASPMLVAHAEEWQSGFDYSNSRAFVVQAGHLVINGGEVQNTMSATDTGYAAEISSGHVLINDAICEVNTAYLVAGGEWRMDGGRTFNTQSVTSQFKVLATAPANTSIRCSGHQFIRNSGVGSFSAMALVDNIGSNPAIRITFADCEIYDWAKISPLVKANAQSVRFTNTLWVPDGSTGEAFMLDHSAPDLLDRPGIDSRGITQDGFYFFNAYGGGTTNGHSSDVPNASYVNSYYVNATGEAGYFTADDTSLATLRQTATRVVPGDKFLMEGWVKKQSGTDAGLAIVMYAADGTLLSGPLLLVAGTNGGFVSSAWAYVRQVVTIPTPISGPPPAFVGFGAQGKVGEVRFIGLQVRRADAVKR
ncbi:hypothetical protein [Sphingomonas melonis]|uniref:hypothetical protein n=1 Tax=Sphingomonas melonis TaxID=152682 RepID=UPI0036909C26